MHNIVTSTQGWNAMAPYLGTSLREYRDSSPKPHIRNLTSSNKGWRGRIAEDIAGLAGNDNRQDTDYSDGWEQKAAHYRTSANYGFDVPSEPLAITKINPKTLSITSFENSDVYKKGSKLHLIRLVGAKNDPFLKDQFLIDIEKMKDGDLCLKMLRQDYASIAKMQQNGCMSSAMLSAKNPNGTRLLIAKTKGEKGDVSSRAFYYTRHFLLALNGDITIREMATAFNDDASNRIDLFVKRIKSRRPVIVLPTAV